MWKSNTNLQQLTEVTRIQVSVIVSCYLEEVEDVDAVEVLGGLTKTNSHCLLASSERHTGIVVLLVRLIISIGVSDLSLEVVVVGGFVVTDSVPVGPLGISINVHLDDTGLDGILNIINRRSRSSVEDEEHGLIITVIELLRDVFLGVVQDDRLEVNISRGINSVDVSERGCTSEHGVLNLVQLLVRVPNLLGLGVKTSRINIGVINTVFLSPGDTKLEFKKNVHLSELLHVLLADANVFLQRLLRQVKHVGREEGLSVLIKVLLVGGNKTIHPRQPSLLTVISVQNNGDSVKLSNLTNVEGTSNTSSDGGGIVGVVGGLSGNELSATLGEGDHDGASVLLGGFHAGVDGAGSNDVDSWDGISVLLGVAEEVLKSLSSDDTRLDRGGKRGYLLYSIIAI